MTRSATSSRNRALITAFVLAWLSLFVYESLRLKYLSPLAGRPLPKTPLLYPPAGWIMFFRVDADYGFAEVYALKHGEKPEAIDPHAIFATQAVGYDNIHRNVLVSVLDPRHKPGFCRLLNRKFPDADGFAIVHAAYPDLIGQPERVLRQVVYRCE